MMFGVLVQLFLFPLPPRPTRILAFIRKPTQLTRESATRKSLNMAGDSKSLRMKILKAAYRGGFTAIHWDNSVAALKVSEAKLRLAWIKIQLLLVLLYEMFLIYQSLKPLEAGASTSRIRVRYVTGLWIFMNCDHILNIWTSDYVDMMNKLNHYTRKNNNQLKANEARGSHIFTKVLAFIGTFTTLTVTITVLRGSSSMTLLTSLMKVEGQRKKLWLPWRIPPACFHFITNGFHLFAYWLQWTSIVSFSTDISKILESMRPRGKGQNLENFGASVKFSGSYRALGVLHRQFSSFYENYMSQAQAAAIFCVVLNTYQAVVAGNVRSLVLALGVALGFIQFQVATAEVYHTSSDVLQEWRRISSKEVPMWFPRFVRSCRYLCVPVGSFFYVDRGLVLTVLSIMLNTSASLIIAH